MPSNNRALLRSATLFAGLTDDELSSVLDIVRVRRLPSESLVFLQGDPADGFFALLEGTVRIYKAAADGRELTLHHVQAGHLFAEAAVFRGSRYPANAITTSDAVVAFFPKAKTIRLLSDYPQIALKLIGSMASWLRDFAQKLEDLSFKDVPGRLAEFLLQEADRQQSQQFDLPISKTELAGRLGTIIETLSRNLRRFKDAGLITVDGPRIELLSQQRLRAVAEGQKVEQV